MKRFVKAASALLAAALLILTAGVVKTEASVYSFGYGNLQPEKVLDVDNNQYPETTKYYVYDANHDAAIFKITKPSVVKAYYTWDTARTDIKISGTAWYSYDMEGVDIIGTKTSISKAPASAVVFLDPGTYYLNHVFTIKNGKEASSAILGVSLLVQEVDTDEVAYATSFTNPTSIAVGRDVVGFLSNNSPYDYYVFEVKNYGRTDITFNFQAEGGVAVNKGTCSVYDINHRLIATRTFNASKGSANVITEYLEAGVYFIEMGGTTCPTYLRADVESYEIGVVFSSGTAYTSKNVGVDIVLDYEAQEILLTEGTISENRKTDLTVWNVKGGMATDITATKHFDVSENSTYTVRVKAPNKEYIVKTITINTIDKNKPVITGAENGKTYTGPVTLTVKDANIKKITLNGAKVKLSSSEKRNGVKNIKVSAAGTNTLVVTDKAGNKTEITFVCK